MEKTKKNSALRTALEDSLRPLGERTVQAIMYDLTIQARIDLDSASLSLEKVYNGLTELLGKEVADILIEDVILKMDEIASEQRRPSPR